jgi:hypothetical protein
MLDGETMQHEFDREFESEFEGEVNYEYEDEYEGEDFLGGLSKGIGGVSAGLFHSRILAQLKF